MSVRVHQRLSCGSRTTWLTMAQPPANCCDHSLDFALLQQPAARHGGRNRRALWWLLGLLALLLGSVVTLLLYLNNFEADDATRRRAADAQWLEQSVQFHFRRLEDDLLVLARQALQIPRDDACRVRRSARIESRVVVARAGRHPVERLDPGRAVE